MCAIRSAVRQRYIFAITELKGSLIVSSFLQVKMGEKKKKKEEYAFVGVCQKVPSLSLTLDGLGLKITIDFSGAGELDDDEQEEVIV